MNRTILWNDGWSFTKTPLGTDVDLALKGDYHSVDIPHDWLIYDTGKLYEDSIGWYKKSFTVTKEQLDGRLHIRFGAVYMDSTVFINGVEVCNWKYGYSTFEVDVTDHVHEGENEILVRAVYQSPNTRWYSGAGIIRDVYFITLEKLHIAGDGVYIRTGKNADGTWKVKCSVELVNEETEGEAKDCTVTLQIAHEGTSLFGCGRVLCPPGAAVAELELTVKDPELWDIECPKLYDCGVILQQEDHILHEEHMKIGFCTKEYLPEQGFLLNGRKVRLNGVCEHHDLGCLGAAFNANAFRRKLMKLRAMGVNAIRTSHNMPAKEVMELADELGFLVDSEGFDMWEKPKTKFDYARFFIDWAERDVASWVRRDRNHVSLIMWSIGNEIYDTHYDEHGQDITRRLVGYVRENDPEENAPVTIGSNYMPWENAQKCADIVKMAGYNYAEKYYEEHHKEHPDWVIYGSETASTLQSRGIYKFPYEQAILTDDDEQCSCLGNCTTSWGAKNTEYCITMDRDTQYSMGQFIWTGFDYIGEPTPYQTKNSYFGQIDTAGFEKDTFYIYQAEWTDYKKAPMVHVFPYWDFSPGQLVDVRVASNAPKVELFLNGTSLGAYDIDHKNGKELLAHYKVPYEAGCLRAVAYDERGEIIAREERHSFTDAVRLTLAPEKESLKADGRDLLYVAVGAVDKDGYPVENANNRVQVRVTGAGRLEGLDNGNSTDFDQYKCVSRRLFSGKLMAVIAAKTEPGEIHIEVSSAGLEPESLVLTAKKAEVRPGVSATEELTRETLGCPEKCAAGEEIPVRNILLTVEGTRRLSPEQQSVRIHAKLLPENATYRELIWKVTNEAGVESNSAVLEGDNENKVLKALGDGKITLRCCSKNGGDKIRLISTLDFQIEGLGLAEFDPYEFVSGSLYTASDITPAMGLEHGVVTKRDGKSYVAYEKVNFGKNGSDVITLPVFELENRPFPIEIWKGIPGAEGSELMDTVTYDKPSVWRTYQEQTYTLPKRFKGICTVSFVTEHDINLKGFSFKKYERAYDKNYALDNDTLYGDTYTLEKDAITGIGNNVSLTFKDMDFTRGVKRITICGRSTLEKNTIHVRFAGKEGGINQLAEFIMPEGGTDYVCRTFELENVEGMQDVNLVFLPGCRFDLRWFRFET